MANPETDLRATPNDRALRTSNDFHPEVLRLFDKYVHNLIDRRGFLDGAAPFTGDGRSAADLLRALSPRFAEAQQVPPTNPGIKAEYVAFPSPQGHGQGRGYLVQPATARAGARLPVILVVHENRGLNPHIEDVARRLALDNFVAFAPDALSPLGGYPGDEDQARELFAKLDRSKTREDLVAAASFLKSRPEGNGRLGVVGFCYGGGIANFLATRLPDLGAAVAFYGSAPATEEVARIRAPLLIHFAETDERINASWPDYQAALVAAGVRHQAFTYPGTQHGFHNDTTPRYQPAAAQLAWQRTIGFFERTLRG